MNANWQALSEKYIVDCYKNKFEITNVSLYENSIKQHLLYQQYSLKEDKLRC